MTGAAPGELAGLPPAWRRGCGVLFWATLLAVAFVTLSPIADRPETPFGPQVEHFIAFALVSGLAMLAYPAQRLRWFWAIVAVAGALEAGQNLVDGRHGRVIDFDVKACGALAGAVMALMLGRFGGFVARRS